MYALNISGHHRFMIQRLGISIHIFFEVTKQIDFRHVFCLPKAGNVSRQKRWDSGITKEMRLGAQIWYGNDAHEKVIHQSPPQGVLRAFSLIYRQPSKATRRPKFDKGSPTPSVISLHTITFVLTLWPTEQFVPGPSSTAKHRCLVPFLKTNQCTLWSILSSFNPPPPPPHFFGSKPPYLHIENNVWWIIIVPSVLVFARHSYQSITNISGTQYLDTNFHCKYHVVNRHPSICYITSLTQLNYYRKIKTLNEKILRYRNKVKANSRKNE